MDTKDLRGLLDVVQSAYQEHTDDPEMLRNIKAKMHDLAEAQYPPAFSFFTSCLDDPDWWWRVAALRCLGFHYDFPSEGPLVDRIRQMLLTDSGGDGEIRAAAAIVLGIRSRWPDEALETALQRDPDELVRAAAFGALLNLARVPFSTLRVAEKSVANGEVQPTWAEVQRIIAQSGRIETAKRSDHPGDR
jgi:hypothetical protein